MRALRCPVESTRHARAPWLFSAALAVLFISVASSSARADIFRCIGADGTSTFSDHACEAPKSNEPSAPVHGSPVQAGDDVYEQRPDSPREKKAARILDVLRIAPVAPEGTLMSRTVDAAAPDLVKSIDPDNGLWTPANGRGR